MIGAIQTDFVVSPGTARLHHDTRFLPHIKPTEGPDYITSVAQLREIAEADLGEVDISFAGVRELARRGANRLEIDYPQIIIGAEYKQEIRRDSDGNEIKPTMLIPVLSERVVRVEDSGTWNLFAQDSPHFKIKPHAYLVDGARYTAGL